MDEEQSKAVYAMTSEMHDDVDSLYELATDGEDVTKTADALVAKIKHFKSNLTKSKSEI